MLPTAQYLIVVTINGAPAVRLITEHSREECRSKRMAGLRLFKNYVRIEHSLPKVSSAGTTADAIGSNIASCLQDAIRACRSASLFVEVAEVTDALKGIHDTLPIDAAYELWEDVLKNQAQSIQLPAAKQVLTLLCQLCRLVATARARQAKAQHHPQGTQQLRGLESEQQHVYQEFLKTALSFSSHLILTPQLHGGAGPAGEDLQVNAWFDLFRHRKGYKQCLGLTKY